MSSVAAPLRLLHRRLAAGLGLAALAAFISGAGLDTPSPLLAVCALLLALVWAPGKRLQHLLDPVWRILALVLAARALYRIVTSPEDVVLPMVDLLLVLLVSETVKESGAAGDTRVYSLSFALMVAACAYRPGVVFALSFVAYTGLATVTLMVGHLIRKLSEHQARDVRLDRVFLLRIAGLASVMLALSAVFFAAFPRVSRNWVARNTMRAASIVGFSDRVSLAEYGSRIQENAEVVLRIEFPDGAPSDPGVLYWRGRSYDMFDGVAWHRSPAIPRTGPSRLLYSRQWGERRVRQRIYAIPLETPVIFGLHPALSVSPHTAIRALNDNVGDLWYFGSATPTYDVVSAIDPPAPAELRMAGSDALRSEDFYLQLPPLPERVFALADSLTRGRLTRYDAVLAVQNWLRTEFRYTLDLPATPREATLEHFLFRRRAGHCEYFSTALAVLLRAEGIPARNVNGFLGGTWNDFGNYLTVSHNEAHSWVEVYFPDYGWIPFDATASARVDGEELVQGELGPLRGIIDGLEHRWNKYILEYNLEKQVSLFRRATEPFAQRDVSGRLRISPALALALKYAVVGALLVAIAIALMRRTRSRNVSPEARVYLKLRRSYERAGFELRKHDAPMQFVERLEQANAPGRAAARTVIELYLRSRFGGEELGMEGQRELRAAAKAARRALRAA